MPSETGSLILKSLVFNYISITELMCRIMYTCNSVVSIQGRSLTEGSPCAQKWVPPYPPFSPDGRQQPQTATPPAGGTMPFSAELRGTIPVGIRMLCGGSTRNAMACRGPRSPEVPTAACPTAPRATHAKAPSFRCKDLISLSEFL